MSAVSFRPVAVARLGSSSQPEQGPVSIFGMHKNAATDGVLAESIGWFSS